MNIQKATSRNRGTISHEATMAIVIATAVLAGVAQTVAVVGQQRREAERQAIAQREVANVMEEVAVRPWHELTKESFASLSLSTHCSEVLPDPVLLVDVDNVNDGGKRVVVEVDWQTASGLRVDPIRLVAWRYPTGEATDE